MLRLVANPLVAWLCLDGDWMTFDPTTKLLQVVECPDLPVWQGLLRIIEVAAEPLARHELVARLTNVHLRHGEADALVASAVELGILIDADTAGPWHRHAAEATDPNAIDGYRFLSLLPCQEYLDYSRPTIFEEDRQQMREQVAHGDPQPSIVKEYPNAARVRLPHPNEGPPKDAAGRIAHLLYFAFGALREARFLGVLPMLFKAVPSMGARHPLEAYLVVGTGVFLEPGVYHYEVMHNALARISDVDASTAPGFHLVVTTVFERSQWRYQHNLGYKDVLHDLGHVIGTIHMMAEHLGVEIRESSPSGPWPHSPLLEECPLAVFQVGALS